MISPWKHDLNTFINIVHVSKSSFKRKICGSEFAEYDVMERYMDAAYEGKRSFKYNICGNNFKVHDDLNSHLNIHGPLTSNAIHDLKKPFNCNICGKNFEDDNDLDSHISNINGASTSSEPVKNSSKTPKRSSSNLKPTCKSIWLNENCKTSDFLQAHPHGCQNPDCLIMDQGLPCWKTLHCQRWHGHPKQKTTKKHTRHLSKPFKEKQEILPPLPGNRTSSRY